jgi:hypothetical protein
MGTPNMRIVYVPHPIANRPTTLCNQYINGKDPITGKPILDELVSALTKPLSDEDKKSGFLARAPRPRMLEPNTAANLEQMFHDNNWTDGLPMVLPTEQKVAEMLRATSHKPDELVGTMRASSPHEGWEYNVEMVAVNAVMAGARPEYFPVILAIASTGATSLLSSTSSAARMVVVNGPIREQIKMNSGIGSVGPFSQANSTIGRAWTLISKNLGGSGTPGDTYMGTLGNNLNYNNICFAEAEDQLPSGWNPVHVQKGFKPGDSAISTFNGWSVTQMSSYYALPPQETIRQWLTHFLSTGSGSATLLLDPLLAKDLRDQGFETKEKACEWLAINAKTPAWLYWANRANELKQAKAGIEPFASYLKLGEEANIPVSSYLRKSPQGTPSGSGPATSIGLIVVGGGTNAYWAGSDFSYATSSSVDRWR